MPPIQSNYLQIASSAQRNHSSILRGGMIDLDSIAQDDPSKIAEMRKYIKSLNFSTQNTLQHTQSHFRDQNSRRKNQLSFDKFQSQKSVGIGYNTVVGRRWTR